MVSIYFLILVNITGSEYWDKTIAILRQYEKRQLESE
jgi:hypothetical protein